MPATLRYGAESSVRMELRNGVVLAESSASHTDPLDDPAGAAARALAEPLDYPPLAQSVLPADRVVIPVAPRVPHAGEIVAAAVRCLVGAGVEPDGVTVLRTEADARAHLADPRPWLAEDVSEQIALVVHEPANRDDMAYLASAEAGDPILLNRALTDADVVLPIGGFRSRSSAGYFGIHTTIFPTFSDQRTLQRYRSPTSHDARGRPKRKPGQLADEVGWLLGVTLTVQVVPGPGDRVLHVVAGETKSVRRRAKALYEAAWRCSVPRRASLVVATIEGSPARQTWESVGRALAVAGGLVEDGGAIAVCCDLADAPGPAVRQLAAAPARDEAMRWIRRERPADALPATLLAQALDRATIYLLSRLDPSLLEDLEVAPVAKAEELVRLAGRHASCILLADAPHALIRLEKDA